MRDPGRSTLKVNPGFDLQRLGSELYWGREAVDDEPLALSADLNLEPVYQFHRIGVDHLDCDRVTVNMKKHHGILCGECFEP